MMWYHAVRLCFFLSLPRALQTLGRVVTYEHMETDYRTLLTMHRLRKEEEEDEEDEEEEEVK